MKLLSEIKFGFSDAENYRRRENKDIFNQFFVRTDDLDRLCGRNVFFLVGDKGTGKTAYAVYLSNSAYNDNVASHRFIRETDYQKFISLKQSKNLSLSDYTDIWKVILYLLISGSIYERVGTPEFLLRFSKFKAIKDAIDEYYDHAFSPEIPTALQFIENSQLSAELVARHLIAEAKSGASTNTQTTKKEEKFQTNLLSLEKNFESAIASLKLKENYVLFVDGIDIRPSSIPYADYLDCVKGLANAVWSINNDFFPSIRDFIGRLRVVLLVRPDIFNSLGLQNRNTKLRDNSVVLDWRTTYPEHRESNLFMLADRMFSVQQDQAPPLGEAWDHYFPFNAATVYSEQKHLTSFIVFLRYSFYRPRDVLTILDILNVLYVPGTRNEKFAYEDLFTPAFRRAYGDYMLGEIKDSLSFYYHEEEFEDFLKFFEFLSGAQKFHFSKFCEAHASFLEFMSNQDKPVPAFMRSPEEFLQFLYDLGIVGFFEQAEDETFIRWSFRERGPTNLSPKVRTETEYEIHYALANVLNTGKHVTSKSKRENSATPSTVQGTIKWFDPAKGFGFIVQRNLPVDIFFHQSSVLEGLKTIKDGDLATYSLEKDKVGRLVAKGVRITKK